MGYVHWPGMNQFIVVVVIVSLFLLGFSLKKKKRIVTERATIISLGTNLFRSVAWPPMSALLQCVLLNSNIGVCGSPD